ncbi:cytochrome c [Paradesertivirga mongoliensis]|uniref:Cytochrome c n=1 Tax=Paradesertivirga mongoliensis TaxID=2100740 RepID=A0ABW4ZPU8_9SPHI|nr:cbb3-type cytochrome c oxidase subunit II [Pedobacter mongoliensis]
MEFFNNHNKLFTTALLLFLFLTIMVCIMPAMTNQRINAALPNAIPLSEDAIKGKALYISNGCVACHTQQVRSIEMDNVWGERPSVAADYANNYRTDFWRNTATLMGTERTGPDLANIGQRQPSADWHLPHLFNPRIVVKESIMPAYPWLFTIKDKLEKGDTEVNIPEEFMKGRKGKVVATEEALQLVAYLQELKQAKLPNGTPEPEFLYPKKPGLANTSKPGAEPEMDGAMLYSNNCQSCHQANGEGLKGAFPPLKGSKVVLDDNPELMLDIIMNGYNAQDQFGEMPAVGTNNRLKPAEIAAIMNHERTSWGNNSRKVTAAEIEKLIKSLE